MDNLMKLLGGSDASADTDKKIASAPDALMADDETIDGDDDGFNAAAEECMTALQGSDSVGFAEALKHCIELSSK